MSTNDLQDISPDFEIEKTQFAYNITPIQINDHESMGPFVRISQSSGENYIYITLFFKQIIKGEDIYVRVYQPKAPNHSKYIVYIQPKGKVGLDARNKWSIVLNPKKSKPFENIEHVDVQVNFNENGENPIDIYSPLGQPRRGTKVIPPN